MVEPTDAIVPLLQRIQAELTEVRATLVEHGGRFDALERILVDQTRTLSQHSQRLDEMNGYLSFSLGITSRHTSDFEAVRVEIDAIKRRLNVLERQD